MQEHGSKTSTGLQPCAEGGQPGGTIPPSQKSVKSTDKQLLVGGKPVMGIGTMSLLGFSHEIQRFN